MGMSSICCGVIVLPVEEAAISSRGTAESTSTVWLIDPTSRVMSRVRVRFSVTSKFLKTADSNPSFEALTS